MNEEKIKYIVENLNELKYGNIQITIHNGEITQIDITEKKRFQNKRKYPKEL